MTLIIDPSKEGFEKVLRDFQIESLKHIWKHDGPGLTSREVFEKVNHSLGPDKSVSRASIINFLNDMCDEGVLDFDEETCKGGMRRKYFKGLDEAGFKRYIALTVLESLMKDFPVQTKEAIKETLDEGHLDSLSK